MRFDAVHKNMSQAGYSQVCVVGLLLDLIGCGRSGIRPAANFLQSGRGLGGYSRKVTYVLFLGEFFFIFCFPFVKMPFLYICVLRTNGNMLGQKGIQESKMER